MVRTGLEAWFADQRWEPKGERLSIIMRWVPATTTIEHKGRKVWLEPPATDAALERMRKQGTVAWLDTVQTGAKTSISYRVWYPGDDAPNCVTQTFVYEDNRWEIHGTFAIK